MIFSNLNLCVRDILASKKVNSCKHYCAFRWWNYVDQYYFPAIFTRSALTIELSKSNHFKFLSHSLGGKGEKVLRVSYWFSSIFDNSRKNNGQAFSITFAAGPYNCYNHAYALGQHILQSQSPLLGRGSLMFMSRVKTLSARDCHWRTPKHNNDRECSNMKALVSVHWLAQCQPNWPSGLKICRKFQHSAGV